MAHAPETGAIKLTPFLAPVFHSCCEPVIKISGAENKHSRKYQINKQLTRLMSAYEMHDMHLSAGLFI